MTLARAVQVWTKEGEFADDVIATLKCHWLSVLCDVINNILGPSGIVSIIFRDIMYLLIYHSDTG